MESPPDRSAVRYLPWTGDFTLPRLRAKLANKYLLHPDVEPDYVEVYRSDLSQMAMVRSPACSRDAPGATDGAAWTWSPQSRGAGGGFVGAGSGGGSVFNLTGPPSAGTVPAWRTALAEQRVHRVASVPSLGVRRAERAPASLQPLSMELSQSQKLLQRVPSSSSPRASPVPMSPSAEERREVERERQAEGASRRLWSSAHGCELHITRFVEEVREEQSKPTSAKEEDANERDLRSRLSKEPFPAMRLAIKAGGKIDWQNPEWDGATLLLKSVRTESFAIVLYMIALGADHTITDDSGRGLLHWAAVEGLAKFVEYFLRHLPDQIEAVNLPDNGGDCPLHLASYHGHLPVARLLVRSGADCALANDGGHTPLDLAQAARMWHVVSYLAEFRQQEEDRGLKEPPRVRDLLRPCDVERADAVREILKDMPKPKAKKDDKKKKK